MRILALNGIPKKPAVFVAVFVANKQPNDFAAVVTVVLAAKHICYANACGRTIGSPN